jgi:hypothetical protein
MADEQVQAEFPDEPERKVEEAEAPVSAEKDSLGAPLAQYALGPRGVNTPKDIAVPAKEKPVQSDALDAVDSVGNPKIPEVKGPRGSKYFPDTYRGE